MDQSFEYDVALSFAGEDRSYVSEIATILKARGIAVFYDEFDKINLWGKDLYEYLDDIYRKKARYCIIFISSFYADKLWTSHERKSAQARAFQSNEDYILPARFDETEIPGIRPTTGYIDLSNLAPSQFADLVAQKLSLSTAIAKPSIAISRDSTKIQIFFNPTTEIKATLSEIEKASKLSIISPLYRQTFHIPVSLSGGYYEKTHDSLLFQKKRQSSIKDETRIESFRIRTDCSFQWIDVYHLKSDQFHLFSTDYLVEQLIYSFNYGYRWLRNLSSMLDCNWQEIVIGVHASIPNEAIIFDQLELINTKLESAYFKELSGEAKGVIRFPFNDLFDLSVRGKHITHLMDSILNSFEYEFNTEKGFASVDQNSVQLLVQAYEKDVKV